MRVRLACVPRRASSRRRYSSAGASMRSSPGPVLPGVCGSVFQHCPVEKIDERRYRAKHREQVGIKTGADREVRGVFTPGDELLVAQVRSGGMISRVATRYSRQLLTVELSHGADEFRRGHDSAETAMVAGDSGANRLQIGR